MRDEARSASSAARAAVAESGEPAAAGSPDPARRRRRSRSGRRSGRGRSGVVSRTRQRVRLVYFVLASLWGFSMGTAAIVSGLTVAGRQPRLDGPTALALAGAVVVAMIGGGVAAAAYGGAADRFR